MTPSSLTCPSCQNPLPLVDVDIPDDGALTCPSCGASVVPVPAAVTTIPYHDPGNPLQSTGGYSGSEVGDRSEPGAAIAPPGYEILSLLGTGGMGAVYKARQLALKRLVALKVIRRSSGDESMRARFRTEAEAAARLQHPNVVQVFEVGEHAGELYCVQEYVPGGSLARKLAGNPLPAAHAARLVESLAAAMAHAHQRQLIHRDLKPANILLRPRTERDEKEDAPEVAVADCDAKVADFGLAKLLDPDAPGLTQHNAVLGTPSYMAPEQALGKEDIGPAADIYALGAILYECLTGRPPFRAATVWETLDLVRTAEPVPPRQLQPGVPRDLETICLQCLRKDPKRRYASAQDLADDLARFARGEPVRARTIGSVERTIRWVRRRPVVAGLLALLVVTVVGFSAVLIERNIELKTTITERDTTITDRDTAITDRDTAITQLKESKNEIENKNQKLEEKTTLAQTKEMEARKATDVARRGMFAATLANVFLLVDKDPDEGLALLEDNEKCPPHLRDFTWKLLHAACQRNRFTIRVGSSSEDANLALGMGRAVSSEVVFPAPDVLVGLLHLQNGIRVRRFQAANGLLLGEQLLPGHVVLDTERRIAVVFTPAGDLTRWDLASGREIAAGKLEKLRLPPPLPAPLRLPGGEVSPLAHVVHTFSHDLQLLALVDADQKVLVYDVRSGKLLHHLSIPSETTPANASPAAPVPLRLRFTPNRERLLCVVQTQKESPPGGRQPATAAAGAIHVWDTASGRHLHRLSKSGRPSQLEEVSPDGQWLVGWVPSSGNKASDLELFNLTTGKVLDVTRHAGVAVRLLRFAPAVGQTRQLVFICRNGGMVAGDASESNTVLIWDLAGESPRVLAGHRTFDAHGILSPEGKTLAVGTSDGLRVFDVATGQLLIGSTEQLARPDDVRYRSQLEKQRPIGFTPDGKRLITPGIKIWDLASRRELLTLPGSGQIFFSPDGRKLAIGAGAHVFTLYEADTEPILGRPLPWNEPVESVSLTPDGRTVAMLGGELRGFPIGLIPRLLLFDLTTARQRAVVYSSDSVTVASTAAFVADGSALSINRDGELQLYDPRGQIARAVRLAPRQPGGLAPAFPLLRGDYVPRFPFVLNHDGRQAILVGSATQLEVRDLETNKIVETLDTPVPLSCRPVLTANSSLVAAGLSDGRVIVWDRAAKSRRLSSGWHAGSVTAVTIDARGERVASLGSGAKLGVWELETGAWKTFNGAGRVSVLALSPDGRTLVTGSGDGGVRFWDPVTGQSRGTFRRHLYPVSSLAFAANGTSLVTAGSGGRRGGDLLSWHIEEGAIQHKGSLETVEQVQRLALSPDGTRLLTATGSGRKQLWDLAQQKEIEPTERPASPPVVRVPPKPLDLEALRRALEERKSNAVDPEALRRLLGGREPGPAPPSLIDVGFTDDGRTWSVVREFPTAPQKLAHLVTLRPDGRREEVSLPALANLFTRAAGRPVALAAINPALSTARLIPYLEAFDLTSGKVTTLFETEEGVDFQVGPSGRHVLARSSRTNEQRILDARSGKVLWTCPGSSGFLRPEVSFAPGERFVLLRLHDHIEIRDPSTGKLCFQVPTAARALGSPYLSIFSPAARWLAHVEMSTGKMQIFETATGLPKPAPPPAPAQTRMAFTADEKILLRVVNDQRPPLNTAKPALMVWDVEAGKEVRRFSLGTEEGINWLFPLNGTTTVLVFTFSSETGRVFDWRTGKLVREVELKVPGEVPGAGISLYLTADGKTLIRQRQNSCQLWDVATWKLRAAPAVKWPFTVTLSEDGGTLVLIQRGTLRVVDTATGKERAQHDVPLPLPGPFLQVSADCKTCFRSGTRRIDVTREIQVRTGAAAEPSASFRQYTGHVMALALNRDATRAFSAGDDHLIHVWHPGTGKEEKALAGHTGPVQQLALSSDEAFLASAGPDGVRLWDLRTLKERAFLTGHVDAIFTLVFSPDSKLLAAAGEDLAVRLWEVPDGKLRATLQGHRDTIHHAVFNRDGSVIVTCSADKTVKVWNVPPAAKSTRPTPPSPLVGPEAEKLAAATTVLTSDGRALLRGLPSGRLERLDLKTGRRVLLEGGHRGPAMALAVSTDGKLVASGDAAGVVLLHQVETGRKQAEWTEHSLPVRALAFSPDGMLLASGEGGERNLFAPFRRGRILVRETFGGKIRHTLWAQNGGIHALCFTKTGALVSGSDDASVCVWDLDEARIRLRIPLGGPVRALIPHPEGTTLFTITGAGQANAPGGMGPVRRWSLRSGGEAPIRGPMGFGPSMARGLAVSADGKLLLSEHGTPVITIWDLESGRARMVLEARGPTRCLALLADGKTLMAATADGGVESWDLPAQIDRPLGERPVAGEVVAAVQVEGGKSLVGLAIDQGKVLLHVWETATLKDRRVLATDLPPGPGINAGFQTTAMLFAVTEDARLAALCWPGQVAIRVWDLEKGKELQALGDQKLPPACLAFSPDGRWLAWGGADGVVRLWEPGSGRLPAALKGHRGPVSSLAFSPDGVFLATADITSRVLFWEVASGRSAHAAGLDLAEGGQADRGPVQLACAAARTSGYLLATSRVGKVGGTSLWPVQQGKESGTVVLGRPRLLKEGSTGKVTFLDRGRVLLVELNGINKLHDVESGRLLTSFGGFLDFNRPERYFWGRSLLRPESRQVTDGWEVRLATGLVGQAKPPTWRVSSRLPGNPNGLLAGDRETLIALAAEPDKSDAPRLLKVGTAPFVAMPGPVGPHRPTLAPLATEADFVMVRVATGVDGSLAAAAKDGRVRVWGSDGKAAFTTRAGPALTALAFAPDGKRLLLADSTGRLRILSSADGKPQKEWKTAAAATALALSNNGQTLATGHGKGEIVLWKVADGTELRRWTAHERAVEQLAFRAGDEMIASSGADNKGFVWATPTGKQQGWFNLVAPLLRIRYSPDGRYLSALASQRLVVWDAANMKGVLDIPSPLSLDMAWSPDSKTITVASAAQVQSLRTHFTAFELSLLGRSRVVVPAPGKDGGRE